MKRELHAAFFRHGGAKNGLELRQHDVHNCPFSTIYDLTMTKIHIVPGSRVSYRTAAHLMQHG